MKTTLIPVTLQDMLAEAEREIALRRSVYPVMIERRRLDRSRADRQEQRMVAIADLLFRLIDEGYQL